MLTSIKRFLRKWILSDTVYFKLAHPEAKLPSLAYGDGDACFDLYAVESKMIAPRTHDSIDCGIAFEPPIDFEVQVRGRSGLAKQGIQVHWGTGDSNFTGSYGPIIYNHTDKSLVINVGDRVCQVALRPYSYIKFEQKSELSSSNRGSNGFGSSGK